MTTIAEKLTTIKNALKAIKNSIIAKGQTPTGDITTYATAIDNIESGSSDFVGIPREVNSSGVYGYPTENFTFSLPSNTTDLGPSALSYAFFNCETLISADLSSLVHINGSQAMVSAFHGCDKLTSVNLSALSTVEGLISMSNVFRGCKSLTDVNLSSLTLIDNSFGKAFYDCKALASIDLSSLVKIGEGGALEEAFYGCTSLTSVDLSSLACIEGFGAFQYAFNSCTSLTELSFPALTSNSFGSYTNQFNNMLRSVTGCTVHFPSNLESVIGSWSDVTSGFGGNSTQILFDLPATE